MPSEKIFFPEDNFVSKQQKCWKNFEKLFSTHECEKCSKGRNKKRVKKWEIHHRNVRKAENVGAFPHLRPSSKGKRIGM